MPRGDRRDRAGDRRREASRADDAAEARRAQAPRPTPSRLRQRAWPLLEMMRRSQADEADIVWGV